jgi:6-phosphogluconolactonase (cycloisomerase 2 family)
MKTGALSSIGKVEAGKTVMPMAVAPNKRFLYAVVRSQPMRVLTDSRSIGSTKGTENSQNRCAIRWERVLTGSRSST